MDYAELVDEQVDRIEECVAYFPKGKHMRSELAFLFNSMIGPDVQERRGRQWTQEDRLLWLCDALIRELSEWPKGGIRELRGIYCETFTPADGKNVWSQLESCPKPPMARPIVDDGVPCIGASPVDQEFQTALAGVVAKVKR